MERRPGTPVSEDKRVESTDRLIKKLMDRLYTAIQARIVDRAQSEITLTITMFGGGISRCDFSDGETWKPE